MKTPLPEPIGGKCKACNEVGALHCSDPMNCNGIEWHYSETTVRAAMQAAYDEAIEDAADLCEYEFEDVPLTVVADLIRKLKGTKP